MTRATARAAFVAARVAVAPARALRAAFVAALLAASLWPSAAGAQSPGDGPGGPILVVVDPGDAYGRYYAEILRAEGLNEFAVASRDALDAQTLSGYQVVVLAPASLSDGQVSALDGWVQGGGNLIAMRPDPKLAGLLGLGSDTGDLANGYVGVQTGSGPGAGIAGETMQYHGQADLWSIADTSPVATLYSSASTPTPAPAVTLRSVGAAGGHAAAFAYDLARSVVWTRQGNPAWAGQERDGSSPIRSDDLFFGGGEPDWVNLDKVHIPQADEQQRLLSNLITQMNLNRAPLPRFWYFPRGEKAVVIMTGDDHNIGGTSGQFDTFERESPPNCSVADWECIRATSYVYPGTISDARAAAYQAAGFEIGLHLNTDCADAGVGALRSFWANQRSSFGSAFPSVAAPRTSRTHCIVWSDWDGEPIAEREQGVRLDTNYYYWPASWMLNRPGMFTGSGIPMRFSDSNGSLIDVYQAATQVVDEWGDGGVLDLGVSAHITQLLDRAVGPEGYYGAFTANMHTDQPSHPGADAIVAAAKARGVPVISAVQMLDWLDGRNGSSFQGVSFSGDRLGFTVSRAAGARGLEAMVPASSASGALIALTRDGAAVDSAARIVKGIEYRVFDAAPGAYVATYAGSPASAPVPTAVTRPRRATLGSRARSRRRARVVKHTARVSRSGIVRLRVRCPRARARCRVDIRLRHRGRRIAKRSLTLVGGRTTRVRLHLTRRARALLARSGRLRVKAIVRTTDGERSPARSTTRIRLLAR